jgi:hypothetical protein
MNFPFSNMKKFSTMSLKRHLSRLSITDDHHHTDDMPQSNGILPVSLGGGDKAPLNLLILFCPETAEWVTYVISNHLAKKVAKVKVNKRIWRNIK